MVQADSGWFRNQGSGVFTRFQEGSAQRSLSHSTTSGKISCHTAQLMVELRVVGAKVSGSQESSLQASTALLRQRPGPLRKGHEPGGALVLVRTGPGSPT